MCMINWEKDTTKWEKFNVQKFIIKNIQVQ